MRLITRQSLANEAAVRWGNQYPIERWPDKQHILIDLLALGPSPNPDDVDQVIGNTSWTRVECHECGADADVIELSQEPDYESYTACICKECLSKALSLINP